MKKENRNLIIGLVVGAVVIALIFWGLSLPSTEINTNNSNNVIPNSVEPSNTATINEKTAEQTDFCYSIIPSEMYFDCYNNGDCPLLTIDKWEDNTSIGTWTGPYLQDSGCHKGNKEGENINFRYCKNLMYSKTDISSDGQIGETNNYYIDLIIKSENCQYVYPEEYNYETGKMVRISKQEKCNITSCSSRVCNSKPNICLKI